MHDLNYVWYTQCNFHPPPPKKSASILSFLNLFKWSHLAATLQINITHEILNYSISLGVYSCVNHKVKPVQFKELH